MPGRKIGIVGVTGFIGGKLAVQASGDGWEVCGFSRSGPGKNPAVSEWRRWTDAPDLSGLDAVVNLAGYPIDRRWTDANRRRFRSSRVGVTQVLVASLAALSVESRPQVLVNGSAVGIYGNRGDEILDDQAYPGGGYLAGLCRDWESAADEAGTLGIRTAKVRTGIVLSPEGPAFQKMLRLFKLGLGGNMGSGSQWMPWIHITDLVRGILHVIGHPKLAGPVNGVSPEPERNRDFTRELAKILRRPAFFHAPEAALKLALGEFGGALVESQRAIPQALLEAGFRFDFPELSGALMDLTGKK